MEGLFGNITEVAHVSENLLFQLDTDTLNKDFNEQIIGNHYYY